MSLHFFMPQFHQLHLADKARLQNEVPGNAKSRTGKSQMEMLGGTGAERLRPNPELLFPKVSQKTTHSFVYQI